MLLVCFLPADYSSVFAEGMEEEEEEAEVEEEEESLFKDLRKRTESCRAKQLVVRSK